MGSTEIVIVLAVFVLILVCISMETPSLSNFYPTLLPMNAQARLILEGYVEWESKWLITLIEDDFEQLSRADCEVYLRVNSLCFIYFNFLSFNKVRIKRTQLLNAWMLDKAYFYAIAFDAGESEYILRNLLITLSDIFPNAGDEESNNGHSPLLLAFLSFHVDRVQALMNHCMIAERELRVLALNELLKAVDMETVELCTRRDR